ALTVSPGASIARPPIWPVAAGAVGGWYGDCRTTAYGSVTCAGALLASGPTSRSRRTERAGSTVQRPAGALSRQPYSTPARAPARPAGAGGSSTTARIVSNGSRRSNGGRPSTAVYRVTPSENRSLGGPNLAPIARSGEMKCGEPSTMPGVVSSASVGI